MEIVRRICQFVRIHISFIVFSGLAMFIGLPTFASGGRSWLSFITDNLGIPTPPYGTQWEQPDLVSNTYIVVVFVALLFFLGSLRLNRLPETKFQMFLEMFIGNLVDFFSNVLGKHGQQYTWFVGSYFIFILFLNYLGLIPGFQSPTADLNTTLALGLTAVIGVNIISIKENGLVNHIKHFIGEPAWLAPLMFPLHAIGEVARAASLALRLFGNIFGEETVIINITLLGVGLMALLPFPLPIPVQLPMLFFGLLGGFLQAFVFSLLTSVYIVTFLDHGDDHGHH